MFGHANVMLIYVIEQFVMKVLEKIKDIRERESGEGEGGGLTYISYWPGHSVPFCCVLCSNLVKKREACVCTITYKAGALANMYYVFINSPITLNMRYICWLLHRCVCIFILFPRSVYVVFL
jgi:hypothetical protein